MEQEITIRLSQSIVYVDGTVNGVSSTYVYEGEGIWSTTAERAADGRYVIQITATDDQGNTYSYDTVKYYGIYLITDRTQADLDQDTDRAYIDYEDLNRVEGAVQYISDRLAAAGYESNIVSRDDWMMTDIRTQADMNRLRNNINDLRRVFCVLPTTPATPANITYDSINQANDIEQILKDLDLLEAYMEMDYKYSSEPVSGEEIAL